MTAARPSPDTGLRFPTTAGSPSPTSLPTPQLQPHVRPHQPHRWRHPPLSGFSHQPRRHRPSFHSRLRPDAGCWRKAQTPQHDVPVFHRVQQRHERIREVKYSGNRIDGDCSGEKYSGRSGPSPILPRGRVGSAGYARRRRQRPKHTGCATATAIVNIPNSSAALNLRLGQARAVT